MLQTVRAIPLVATLFLAGCSFGPSQNLQQNASVMQPPTTTLPQPTLTPVSVAPVQRVQTAETAMTDVSAYIDSSIISRLSEKERAEAASAQFNALTFGRPGAPRSWSGDRGASGQVTVGPYVRVNNIDCRDFTHTVTVGGTPFARKGTACKDVNGDWSVSG